MPTQQQKAGKLWTLVMLLVVVALAVVYYKFHDYFEPKTDILLTLDPGCDLRSDACITKVPPDGNVSFSISPNDIPLLKPLQLKVQTQGVNVSRVEVDFAGIGMNMGFNRTRLTGNPGDGFAGEATLPVCIRNRMDWEAKVILHTDQGVITAPFHFHTIR